MYTPDGVEIRLEKVSRTAARMYLYHCRWRDHQTGYSRKGFEHARADLKLTRATAYRAHKELLDLDFISETGDGLIGLRGGSFKPVDKTEKATLVWSKARPKQPENGSLKFETAVSESLKTETENLISETGSLKFETEHIEERARGLSSTSSSNIPTHTHTIPARAREAEPPDGGGVCVPELTFQDYRGFARTTAGFTKPDAWAMKHFPLRDADVLVAEWKARQAQVQEGRRPVDEKLTPYHVAAQYVDSMRKAPGYDVAGYIAQMPNVSEETRAKLRSTFLDSPEQGRARAPP